MPFTCLSPFKERNRNDEKEEAKKNKKEK